MRIDAPKVIALALPEGQEVASVSNRRVPRNLVSQHGGSGTFPPLELGQELEAFVVDELDGGRVLLKLGAMLIEAESPGGLGPGQHIRLRVERLQPQLVLHITDVEMTTEAEATRLLRSHLPARGDAGELLDSLRYSLASLVDQPSDGTPWAEKFVKLREAITMLLALGAPITPEKLKTLARDGGLFYEAKLFDAAATQDAEQLLEIADSDLKGLLLAALQESKARAFSNGLQKALSAQLANLETQQAVNLLAQLEGGAIHMQIPFFTGARFSTAVLAVEPDGQGEEGKRQEKKNAYALLFMLDLEHFGRTRVDAQIADSKLRAIFFVDDEVSLQLISEELPGFRDTLTALGYRDVFLAAKPLRELPRDKQERFAALAAGAPPSIHLVDMKA